MLFFFFFLFFFIFPSNRAGSELGGGASELVPGGHAKG